MINTKLGPYRIESDLGSGGMGMVYLAELVEAAAGLEPGTRVALKVVYAHLPGGDAVAALVVLEEHEQRVGHLQKMDARFRLWELTQDRAHLIEAHRLLTHLRDHAPEQDRVSMIENVPLHRDIMAAAQTLA